MRAKSSKQRCPALCLIFGSVNNIVLKYLNIVKSNDCFSSITEPFRVTSTCATTIDLIISSQACYEVTHAVLQ